MNSIGTASIIIPCARDRVGAKSRSNQTGISGIEPQLNLYGASRSKPSS